MHINIIYFIGLSLKICIPLYDSTDSIDITSINASKYLLAIQNAIKNLTMK